MKTVEPQIVRAIIERQALRMKAQFFRALADAYDPTPRDGAQLSADPAAKYHAREEGAVAGTQPVGSRSPAQSRIAGGPDTSQQAANEGTEDSHAIPAPERRVQAAAVATPPAASSTKGQREKGKGQSRRAAA
jgi:hypothetical protein